jgi:DNA-binding transcriptional LysR family regulator
MDSTYSIVSAVASGLGVAIVSEHAARQSLEQSLIMEIKLQNKMPVRKIYAVLNKNIVHSHLVKLFMEYLIKA